jgi:hypothetical protein
MLEPIPFAGYVEIEEMNNEPVALMTEYGIKPLYEGALQEGMFLYAHPEKTLTDEEIQELALSDEFWISEDCTIFDWHKFARAILRKAQEK